MKKLLIAIALALISCGKQTKTVYVLVTPTPTPLLAPTTILSPNETNDNRTPAPVIVTPFQGQMSTTVIDATKVVIPIPTPEPMPTINTDYPVQQQQSVKQRVIK